MKIRAATLDDLKDLLEMGEEFSQASKFTEPFNRAVFIDTWSKILAGDYGVVFLQLDGEGKPVGAIGGIRYPDPNSGRIQASEMFWYVRPASRGRGLDLLDTFEQWARFSGCSHVRMTHLLDVMPKKLEIIYMKYGYQPIEVNWAKEL